MAVALLGTARDNFSHSFRTFLRTSDCPKTIYTPIDWVYEGAEDSISPWLKGTRLVAKVWKNYCFGAAELPQHLRPGNANDSNAEIWAKVNLNLCDTIDLLSILRIITISSVAFVYMQVARFSSLLVKNCLAAKNEFSDLLYNTENAQTRLARLIRLVKCVAAVVVACIGLGIFAFGYPWSKHYLLVAGTNMLAWSIADHFIAKPTLPRLPD